MFNSGCSDEAVGIGCSESFCLPEEREGLQRGVYEKTGGGGYPLCILVFIEWMSKCFKIPRQEASLSFSLELERNQRGDQRPRCGQLWSLSSDKKFSLPLSPNLPTKVHVAQIKVSFPIFNFLFMLLTKPIQGKFCLLWTSAATD